MSSFKLGPKQQEWVDALRSGKYRQTRGKLGRKVDGVEQHCCLGVLCELAKCQKEVVDDFIFYDGMNDVLSNHMWGEYRLISDNGMITDITDDEICDVGGACLSAMNDGGKTFSEIADVIEEYASNIFIEPI